MSVVLAVEDDPITRAVYTAALSQLEGVSVIGASTVQEAQLVLQEVTPDIILLDLRLPDGFGLEILGNIRGRQQQPSVIVISAHLEEMEPPSTPTQITQLAKPVRVRKLKEAVELQLDSSGKKAPFSLAEYVQLACLGGHSLNLVCQTDDLHGEVCIHEGDVWSTRFDGKTGFAAFATLLTMPGLQVSFSPLHEPQNAREILGSWQELLFEAARLEDEARRDSQPRLADEELDFSDVLASTFPGAKSQLSPPPNTGREEDIRSAVEQGIKAVLASRYPDAVRAFEHALQLDPTSGPIQHRLRRLKELGYS